MFNAITEVFDFLPKSIKNYLAVRTVLRIITILGIVISVCILGSIASSLSAIAAKPTATDTSLGQSSDGESTSEAPTVSTDDKFGTVMVPAPDVTLISGDEGTISATYVCSTGTIPIEVPVNGHTVAFADSTFNATPTNDAGTKNQKTVNLDMTMGANDAGIALIVNTTQHVKNPTKYGNTPIDWNVSSGSNYPFDFTADKYGLGLPNNDITSFTVCAS